jgi:uncharacterized membrane protein
MGEWSDDRLRRAMGALLRWGVAIAAVTAFAGGILYLQGCAGDMPDYRVFRGTPPALRGVAGIFREAASLNPFGVIQLGILLLIATPVARMAFSLAAFVAKRDLAYVASVLIVLSIVLSGLLRERPGAVVPPESFRPMCKPSGASNRPPVPAPSPAADGR